MNTQIENGSPKSRLPGEAGLAAFLLFLVISLLILPKLGNPITNILGWPFCDMPASYYPWREWGFSQILNGHFPFWNHHTYCGNPFAANYETALFYPPNWLFFLLLPTSLALNLSILLHLWMGAFFTYLLARKFKLDLLPAMLSAVGFSLCGPMISRVYAGHITIISALAWFPILLFFVDELLNKPGWRIIFLASLCYGLSALAGHPQVLYYNSLFLLLYGIIRFAMMLTVEKCNLGELLRIICRLGVMVILGVGLAAVQLFLTYNMQKAASRQNFTLETAATYSLSPKVLTGMLLPGIFGNGQTSPFWGPWYHWEIAIFPGLVILILGLSFPVYLLFFKSGDKEGIQKDNRLSWGALFIPAVIFFLTGLGSSTPVFQMLYHIVPAFDSFRGLSRLYGQVMIVVCLASGAALHFLMNNDLTNRKKTLLPIIVFSLFALGMTIFLINHLATESTSGLQNWMQGIASSGANIRFDPETFSHPVITKVIQDKIWKEAMIAIPIIILMSGIALGIIYIPKWKYAFAILLLIICVGDLYRAHTQFIETFSRDSVVKKIEITTDREILLNERIFINDPGISANNALLQGYLTPDGYEPLYPRLYGEWMNAMLGHPKGYYQSIPGPFTPSVCAALGTTQLISPVENNTYQKKTIKISPSFRPRVFLVSDIVLAETEQQTWSLIAEQKLNGKIFIEVGKNETLQTLNATPATTATMSSAKIIRQTPSSLEVSVTNPQSGYLILINNWHPGWKAYIEKSEIPIYHAQFAFQAVKVPESPLHEIIVEFRYSAPGFLSGLIISIISLCIILTGLIFPRKPDIKQQKEQGNES